MYSRIFCFISFFCHLYAYSAEEIGLFCKTVGEGSPIIVVHGGPNLTHDYLLPHMAKLAEGRLVIFYDQRGSGKSCSEISVETMTMDIFANDIEAIRNHFGFKKVSILGHSWGSFVAMHYALLYPQYVEKLILSNSFPASSKNFLICQREWQKRLEPLEKELNRISSSEAFVDKNPDSWELYYQLLFQAYCYDPKNAFLLNLRMSQDVLEQEEKVLKCFEETLFSKEFDIHKALEKLTIPTLIIHGDHDIFPVEPAKEIHEHLPNSCFVLLKDCGHFPFVEKPEEYFHSLNAFLEER